MCEKTVTISFRIDNFNEKQLEKILKEIIELKTYDLKIEVKE